MAPNPLENPPAAVSSSEEEDISSEEETDQDEKKEGLASDDDDDSPVKKPATTVPVAAKASEYRSDSGSQSESEPERTENEYVEPSMEEILRSKKLESAGVDFPANAASKRAATEIERGAKESKRPKKTEQVKKPEELEGKRTGEDTKKQLFQRVFSEDDEISLLQGVVEFTASKGDPYDHMDAFCEFVKKSISFNASKAQLFDKLRRLRKKFEKSVNKSSKKRKNGEDSIFSKAHDQKAFALWKKIWGSDGVLQSGRKSISNSKKNHGEDIRKRDKEAVDGLNLTQKKKEGISGRDMASLFQMERGGSAMAELAVMQGWDMVADGSKKKDLEERLKKIQAAQMELLLQKTEFISEATRLILETLKANVSGFGH